MGKTPPNVGDQEVRFTPEFLHIPAIVAFDKDLQPLDVMVYGVVYWLERLRDGRCYASNATLAKVVGSSASGVANSLVRLREKRYIICVMTEKNQRKEIKTLVFNVVNPYSNEEGGVTQMSNIDNKKESNLSSETLASVKKVYSAWLKVMVVDPEIRFHGSTDDRRAALEAAAKSYRFTPKRRDAIARRLKDASEGMIIRAILSLSKSDFHRGENDNGWKATIEWLCGSYEKVEEWAGKYKEGEQ